MNNSKNKSPGLFTPSGCLTGDALMLYVSGSLDGPGMAKAQKHMAGCPLCADAAEGLIMWIKENESGHITNPLSEVSPLTDFSGVPVENKTNSLKLSGRHENDFHVRTDVINNRIRQRLHTHAMLEANENRRLSYKPFIWLAAAASILILIGSFFVVWIQNQMDSQKLATQRAAEMAMLENMSKSDTLMISLPGYSIATAQPGDSRKVLMHPNQPIPAGIVEDADVLNQDELSVVSSEGIIAPEEVQPEEDQVVMEESKTVRTNNTKAEKEAGAAGAAAKKSAVEDISNSVFTIVEEMPAFPGGETERLKFLSNNITYPQQAAENGIQGIVYVSFIVTAKGDIEDVKLLRGIGSGCDEEAIRVIKKMPRWKPGRQNGKAVRVLYNMPVSFKLNG